MLQYTSILKSRPYLYLELRKACALKIQGFDYNEIKEKSLEENIFAVKTEARKKAVASTVINRINKLDDFTYQPNTEQLQQLMKVRRNIISTTLHIALEKIGLSQKD